MAATETDVLFRGSPETASFAHILAEVHEASGNLIPVYLFLHLGAVILHTLPGHHVWRRISPSFGDADPEAGD